MSTQPQASAPIAEGNMSDDAEKVLDLALKTAPKPATLKNVRPKMASAIYRLQLAGHIEVMVDNKAVKVKQAGRGQYDPPIGDGVQIRLTKKGMDWVNESISYEDDVRNMDANWSDDADETRAAKISDSPLVSVATECGCSVDTVSNYVRLRNSGKTAMGAASEAGLKFGLVMDLESQLTQIGIKFDERIKGESTNMNESKFVAIKKVHAGLSKTAQNIFTNEGPVLSSVMRGKISAKDAAGLMAELKDYAKKAKSLGLPQESKRALGKVTAISNALEKVKGAAASEAIGSPSTNGVRGRAVSGKMAESEKKRMPLGKKLKDVGQYADIAGLDITLAQKMVDAVAKGLKSGDPEDFDTIRNTAMKLATDQAKKHTKDKWKEFGWGGVALSGPIAHFALQKAGYKQGLGESMNTEANVSDDKFVSFLKQLSESADPRSRELLDRLKAEGLEIAESSYGDMDYVQSDERYDAPASPANPADGDYDEEEDDMEAGNLHGAEEGDYGDGTPEMAGSVGPTAAGGTGHLPESDDPANFFLGDTTDEAVVMTTQILGRDPSMGGPDHPEHSADKENMAADSSMQKFLGLMLPADAGEIVRAYAGALSANVEGMTPQQVGVSFNSFKGDSVVHAAFGQDEMGREAAVEVNLNDKPYVRFVVGGNEAKQRLFPGSWMAALPMLLQMSVNVLLLPAEWGGSNDTGDGPSGFQESLDSFVESMKLEEGADPVQARSYILAGLGVVDEMMEASEDKDPHLEYVKNYLSKALTELTKYSRKQGDAAKVKRGASKYSRRLQQKMG